MKLIVSYECMKTTSKYLMIASAGCLFAEGISKILSVSSLSDPIIYILNAYFIILGILIISMELEWERILSKFEFYRYFFGKAFLSLFLGFLVFSTNSWFSILVSGILLFDSFLLVIVGFGFHSHESDEGKESENENGRESRQDNIPSPVDHTHIEAIPINKAQ